MAQVIHRRELFFAHPSASRQPIPQAIVTDMRGKVFKYEDRDFVEIAPNSPLNYDSTIDYAPYNSGAYSDSDGNRVVVQLGPHYITRNAMRVAVYKNNSWQLLATLPRYYYNDVRGRRRYYQGGNNSENIFIVNQDNWYIGCTPGFLFSGSRSVVLKSTDQGNSWSTLLSFETTGSNARTPYSFYQITGIYSDLVMERLLVNNNNPDFDCTMQFTIDGGATWEDVAAPTGFNNTTPIQNSGVGKGYKIAKLISYDGRYYCVGLESYLNTTNLLNSRFGNQILSAQDIRSVDSATLFRLDGSVWTQVFKISGENHNELLSEPYMRRAFRPGSYIGLYNMQIGATAPEPIDLDADKAVQTLAEGLEFRPTRDLQDRKVLTAGLGNPPGILGLRKFSATIPVEFKGGDVAGKAPEWDLLLKAQGFNRTDSSGELTTTASGNGTITLADTSSLTVGDMLLIPKHDEVMEFPDPVVNPSVRTAISGRGSISTSGSNVARVLSSFNNSLVGTINVDIANPRYMFNISVQELRSKSTIPGTGTILNDSNSVLAEDNNTRFRIALDSRNILYISTESGLSLSFNGVYFIAPETPRRAMISYLAAATGKDTTLQLPASGKIRITVSNARDATANGSAVVNIADIRNKAVVTSATPTLNDTNSVSFSTGGTLIWRIARNATDDLFLLGSTSGTLKFQLVTLQPEAVTPITKITGNVITTLINRNWGTITGNKVRPLMTYKPINTRPQELTLTRIFNRKLHQWANGCVGSGFSLQGLRPGELPFLTFNFEGLKQQQKHEEFTDNVVYHNISPPISMRVKVFQDGESIEVAELSVQADIKIAAKETITNTTGTRDAINPVERDITGSLTIYMDDSGISEYFTKFDTKRQFSLLVYPPVERTDVLKTKDVMAIYLPNCMATAYSVLNNDGLMQEQIQFKSYIKTTDTKYELAFGFY